MKLFNRKMSKKQKAALNALADGIECGAQLHPRATGNLVQERWDMDHPVYETCALGAALECLWVKQGKTLNAETVVDFRKTNYDEILKAYGVTTEQFGRRLEIKTWEFDSSSDISTIIWRMNDHANYSREEIAALLRELE